MMTGATKSILIIVWYLLFSIGYKLTGLVTPRYWIQPSSLDSYLSFQPVAIFAYVSHYFIPLCTSQTLKRELLWKRWFASMSAASAVAFFIFAYFPSGVALRQNLGVQDADLAQSLLLMLWSVDPPTNCAPSLHVAISFIAFFYVLKVRNTNLSVFWCLWWIAVTYSTLAVKQHLVFDVWTGLLLAVGVVGVESVAWKLMQKRQIRTQDA